jgi:hypothetical protein
LPPRVDITGAVDLHCHFAPDAHRERSVDAFEAARDAAAAGHAAVVLKSHDYPTAALAWAVDQVVDGIRVFGGICCDREVGGLNPAAVDVALRLGAKVVWLPTLSSQQDVDSGLAARLGLPLAGLRVVDADGNLLPATQEILDLVAGADAVLATGHVSAEEHVAVARAFGDRGRLIVTHAMEEMAGPNLSIDQCVELAELGGFIELCGMTCIGAFASRRPAELAACVRAVGPAQCTIATDYGQKVNPRPAEGLQAWADALAEAGIAEGDIRRMACANPAALIGL